MATPNIPKATSRIIEQCVTAFEKDIDAFKTLASHVSTLVQNSQALRPHIHSVRVRVKEPSHLRDKLERKAQEARKDGKQFNITPKNLYQKIFDLAGVRILHVRTDQAKNIDVELRRLLSDSSYSLVEGPTARTWDDEYRQLFESYGIGVMKSPSMYTSIHYVALQSRKTGRACEIQVRTLMEEVWGEVSHIIDYPHPSRDLACREQIKVLARATSTCTRLVDSIFRSHEHTSKRPGKA